MHQYNIENKGLYLLSIIVVLFLSTSCTEDWFIPHTPTPSLPEIAVEPDATTVTAAPSATNTAVNTATPATSATPTTEIGAGVETATVSPTFTPMRATATNTAVAPPPTTQVPSSTPTPQVQILLNAPETIPGGVVRFSWTLMRNEPLKQTECFAVRIGPSPENIVSETWVKENYFDYSIKLSPGNYVWNVALVLDQNPADICDRSGDDGEFITLKESDNSSVQFNFETPVPVDTPPPLP